MPLQLGREGLPRHAPIIGDPARPAAANDDTFPMAIVAEEADEYLGQLSASSGAALAANAAPITEGPAACYYRVRVDGLMVVVISGKRYEHFARALGAFIQKVPNLAILSPLFDDLSEVRYC